LVAKILVADDNSNIQKMVGLALKDQGIEVVAVGNGEAAVRKISDIPPDLVLADVFMPVRNGYEVCEYVKTDSTLSHIPVILLVGAFDPLDEQEAQRVGADGVLKKPFVPPDPLISMVKSALARAGVILAAANAAKTPEPAPVKATDFLAPRVPAVTPAALPDAPIVALESESFVDEVPAHPEPVRIDAGSNTVAFGSLLDTPASEPEDEAAFMPPANSELATERDWRDPAPKEDEEEEEEEPTGAWRREEAETFADGESDSPKKTWRSTGGFEPVQSGITQVDAWEPAEEKPELHEVSARVQEAPAAAAVPETRAEIPAAPFASDAWAAVIASGAEKKPAEETVGSLEEVVAAERHAQSSVEPAAVSAYEATPIEPEQKPSGSSWFSSASSPWDSEIQKANRLASTWDSAAAPVTPNHESTNGTGKTAELPISSEAVQAVIEETVLPAAAVEAIREEAAQVAEDAALAPVHSASKEAAAEAQPPSSEATAPSMDELVAKVLAKLSPDVLQAVTREILKPVIESMVKEEMNSKKS
jgi:CheY-like chemotaxis protein